MAENTEEKKDELQEEFTADEIHNADLGDLVAEHVEAEANPEPVEEVKEPETPIEEPKAPEPQVPEPQPAPQLDTEALTKNIVSNVVEALAASSDKTAEEKQDIKDDIWKSAPWVKENRQPTYEEALQYTIKAAQPQLVEETVKRVKEELDKELEQEEQTLKQQEEESVKKQQETQKQWNNYWDTQLADLEAKSLIPKIVNKNDPKDPGVKARVDLFTKMREVAEENGKNNRPVSLNLKEIYYEYYKPTTEDKRDPKMAPVAGARKGMTSQDSEEFSYEEIHNAQGFGDILRGTK